MSTATSKGWRKLAACASQDSRDWFRMGNPPPAVLDTCRGCPVRAECLHDALTYETPNGVWGGLTPVQRRRIELPHVTRTEAVGLLRTLLTRYDAADVAVEEEQPTVVPQPAPTAPPPTAEAPTAPATTEDAQLTGRSARARPNGVRYTPEERAVLEPRTVELLRAGASYSEIKAELGISSPTIVRIRRKAGLPPSGRTGAPRPRTKAEVLALHVEQYGDGHARWTGPMAGRMAQLHAENARLNARRVVFEEHHRRTPVGRVRSNCGEQACFAGAHLTDSFLRNAAPSSAPQRPAGAPSERKALPMTAAVPTTAELVTTSKLLAWAEDHPDPDVQAQGARIEASLVGLRQRYDADQELTALTAKRARLEKELAALAAREAELVPPKKKRKSGAHVRDYDTRTVRAWAAEQGIDCPSVGQIPKRVLDAWRTANPKTDGSTP